MRKLGLGVAIGAATLGFAAGPAFAGQSGAVNAVTHTSDHPDTTSASGPCTGSSSNGPVWAYDNLSLRVHVVPQGGDSYAVTIYAHGSFQQIADPNTGACASGHGSVDGWYDLTVQSSTAPDPANVPSQEPGDMSQGAIVAQLFAGNATSIVGGHYSYTYNRIDGGKYTQVG